MYHYSKGPVKICFFFVGLIYGFNTFYTAATVYLEAFRNVPDDLKVGLSLPGVSVWLQAPSWLSSVEPCFYRKIT